MLAWLLLHDALPHDRFNEAVIRAELPRDAWLHRAVMHSLNALPLFFHIGHVSSPYRTRHDSLLCFLRGFILTSSGQRGLRELER